MKERERSQYFQAIAHDFLNARGAPFFLSSTDIDLIATWEKMGIPLKVVSEGIQKAFELHGLKPGERRKVHSLAFCKPHIFKAFEQYRERKVGVWEKKNERDEKRARIKKEVQSILNDLPPELEYLKEVFRRAQKILAPRYVEEEALELMEEEIEELLFRHGPPRIKEKVKREILKKYPNTGEKEFHILFKVKLVKYLRDKYKIPYVSFFYY